jgi:glutamyl-tRNA reductase
MPVLALGLSYRMAPVELLERVSISEEGFAKAYRRLSELDSVEESVLLSTCNRVEVYAEVDGYHTGFQDLKRFLSEATDVPVDELAPPLYSHYEDHAAEHLFSVAAGLDSMVLGEPQILAQVRAAFRRSRDEGSLGPELRALFDRAVRAGRRVRGETSIGASPSAFVDAGLDLAAEHLGDLRGRPALVIGAGEMGSLAASALRERGVEPLVILSRNRERAERLSVPIGATPGSMEELSEALGGVDVVVSSTGATGVVISEESVARATSGREIFLLDLAVPRDIAAGTRELPGVRLADIDDLAPLVRSANGIANQEVEASRAIIEEEVHRYTSERRGRRLAPLIRALREMGEDVRTEELRRIEPRLAALSERDRRTVEALTQRIVARMLHEPTVRLKDLAGRRLSEAPARALAELFGLDIEE